MPSMLEDDWLGQTQQASGEGPNLREARAELTSSAVQPPPEPRDLERSEAEAKCDAGRGSVVEAPLTQELRELARATATKRASATPKPQLPELPEAVTLIAPSGQRITARVEERRRNALVLVIVSPLAPLKDEELQALVMEQATPDGRLQLTGTFSYPDPSSPGEVLLARGLTVTKVLEERVFHRVDLARPVRLLLVGGDQKPVETQTVNVSASGCLLDAPRNLEIHQRIEVEVALMPGQPGVRATGSVVRKDDQGRPGIAFDSIDPLDRNRIIRFVWARRLAPKAFGSG